MNQQPAYKNPFHQALYETLMVPLDTSAARGAVERIVKAVEVFQRDNGLYVPSSELAVAVRGVHAVRSNTAEQVAQDIAKQLSRSFSAPGSALSHFRPEERAAALRRLEGAILSAASKTQSHGSVGKGARASRGPAPPQLSEPRPIPFGPVQASSEVLRDVTQLAQMVVGVSPALAAATLQQSEALAASLAAYQSVSAMRNADSMSMMRLASGARQKKNSED